MKSAGFIKGNCFIPVPHGQLEAIYRPSTEAGTNPGDGGATRVALVLHPHPLHGGTMHNKVVFRTAKSLAECGYETLRFNFRGVGQSTGSYDNGIGETEDARFALQFLLDSNPAAREILVAGFSFGSVVALRLGCMDDRIDRLIAIGVPVRLGSLDLLADCHKPVMFLHGEEDDIAPLAPLREFLDLLPVDHYRQLVTIPGAGHFFDRHAEEMMAAVAEFAGR